MTGPDLINGTFESVGALMQLMNCRQIYRDKGHAGLWVPAWFFFTAWGYFNLYYYPHLDQWLSFSGGVALVLTNSLWVGMALYYGPKGEKNAPSVILDYWPGDTAHHGDHGC